MQKIVTNPIATQRFESLDVFIPIANTSLPKILMLTS